MAYWGVDSVNPINMAVTGGSWAAGGGRPRNARVQAGRNTRTLFDFVVDHYGQAPAFWGRYINRNERSASRLRREEVDYLRWKIRESGHNCKIVPVYNAIRREGFVPTRQQGRAWCFDQGLRAAAEAASLASQAGIAQRTRIYADLEAWEVHPAWLQGWLLYFFQHPGYLPGYYGRVVTEDRFAENDPDFPNAHMPAQQHRYWIQDLPYAAGAPRQGMVSQRPVVWSTRPRAAGQVRTQFEARHAPYVRSVLWQYASVLEFQWQDGRGAQHSSRLLDLDVADHQGYAEMWDVTA